MSSAQEQEDYLDVDTEIPNQKFCVLSFISPENVLKKKSVSSKQNSLKICVIRKILFKNIW